MTHTPLNLRFSFVAKMIALLFLCFTCSYCYGAANNEKAKQKKYSPIEASYRQLMLDIATPDSLLSKERIKAKIKIIELTYKYIEVKNNQVVLNATPNDFVKAGFPSEYYHYCIKDLEDTNRGLPILIKTYHLNLDSIIQVDKAKAMELYPNSIPK